MTTYRLPREVSVLAWEERFGRNRGPLTDEGYWRDHVAKNGLCLDFARAEFVDFAVLARALLLIDNAVRNHVRVDVILPTSAISDAEQVYLDELQGPDHPSFIDAQRRTARQARARGDARAFMRHVGFQDALRADHWPPGAVRIHETNADGTADPIAGSVLASPPGDEPEKPYRLRRIFPFRWLRPLSAAQLREPEFFLSAVAGLRDLGLTHADARALAHTVLTELVENVAQHAGQSGAEPPLALVGAVLLNADTFRSRCADMPAELHELVDTADETGSSVVRLIVGDSGVGVVHRLAPAQARRNTTSGVKLVAGRPPTDTEDTVFYAFDRWSTSRHDMDDVRRGTRGLWRVARLARTYRGSVVVRTADVMAGRVFGEQQFGTDVADDRVGTATGTLLEVNVLIDPHRADQFTPRWYESDLDNENRWCLVNCAFDPDHGLGDADRQRLVEAAREIEQNYTYDGVLATIPMDDANRNPSDRAMQAALRGVLDTAGRIADPTAVVVTFPNADPRILDLCVASIAAEDDEAADQPVWQNPHSPVLVLGMYGRPLWCGGPRALRSVLDALTDSGGALTRAEAERHWHDNGGDPYGLWRTIRDQSHLIRQVDDQFQLRLSPRDALTTLADHAGAELIDHIERSRTGVLRGLFRTPTLGIVTRWVDAEAMINHSIGHYVAAFILAHRVSDRVEQVRGSRSVVVARTSTTPERLASQLSECLALGGHLYGLPGELDLDGIPVGDPVPENAQVVVCTDLILTENTVRRAVAAVVSADAEPVAITCLVDSREVQGPVEILNRSIPVVALCSYLIGVQGVESGSVVDIDPVLRQPVMTRPDRPEPSLIREAEFLDWCTQDPATIRLGHIDRPPRVHFSAYLQLDRLLRDTKARERIIDVIRSSIEETSAGWTAGVDGPAADQALQIWYPGTEDDYASLLAHEVRSGLVDAGHPAGLPVPVPRAVAGNNWNFPEVLSHDRAVGSVIIIDWGVVSATSVHQMIRLAAGSGARSIVVVVLLNQLMTQEAEALAVQHSVAPEGGAGWIPVAVRFVTTTSIGALPAHDCALCTTRAGYAAYRNSAPLRLRRHITMLHEMTRPRNREQVFRSAAIDLFNVPINGQDAADYLRWRGLLQQALRNTSARQAVLDRLAELTEQRQPPGWSRDSLIRLLAAEQQWLKLPPLRFAAAREGLADACTASLAVSTTMPAWLRVQALMVLVRSTPERLVELMPSLLELVVDEPVLVDQMFLDCYRLLLRSPHESPVDVARLYSNLLRCRDQLEAAVDVLGPTVSDHLQVLRSLIAIANPAVRPVPQSPQEAWGNLLEDWVRIATQHRLEAGLLRVRDYVEDVVEVGPKPVAGLAPAGDWFSCMTQLYDRALVNLPLLREILEGDYVGDRFSRADQRRLVDLTGPNSMSALQDVSNLLHQIMHADWQPRDLMWRGMHKQLVRRINWWYRMFVAAHVPDSDRPAQLTELILSAPANLHETLLRNTSNRRTAAAIDGGDPEWRVFCPQPLLNDIMVHLEGNAHRHQIPGADVNIEVRYGKQSATHVAFIVRNTGSRPSRRLGHGLRSFNQKLLPFDGKLTSREITDDSDWTFEVTVTLARWRGV